MILIGVTGKAGSGKDTVGELLHQDHSFATLSFAAPIKAMICELLGVPRKIWDDREWRETDLPVYDCSPRHLAQTIGTEWGRQVIKDSLWLDLALDKVRGKRNSQRWAITDVRFENEAAAIREQGGVIIHVNRATDASESAQKHLSEVGIEKKVGDYAFDNNGTYADLRDAVDDVMGELIKAEADALAKEKAPSEEAYAAQDLARLKASRGKRRGK